MEMDILAQLEKLGAADEQRLTDWACKEAYLAEIRAFLTGQDFLRLGHGINASQWNSVLMGVRRIREKCKVLGITCFDRWLMGIRDAAQQRRREEALLLMTQITAKRVQLRKLLMEDLESCDM